MPRSILYILLSLVPHLNPPLNAQSLVLKAPVRFLALGDSYTIGESVKVEERWPEQLLDSLENLGFETKPVTIIARTGLRTDNLKEAILAQDPSRDYNLVSLLIGVNDQYQGYDDQWYEPGFEELLQMAVEYAGGEKTAVFVLSIPDYAFTPFGQLMNPTSITEDITRFNMINEIITGSYGITYVNITGVSREGLANPDLVATDGLHPSGKMYGRWVSLILEKMNLEKAAVFTEAPDDGNGVSVFPNPAFDSIDFTLMAEREKNISIMIYNASGRLVSRLTSSGSSTIRFNTSEMEPGVYYYSLFTGDGENFRGKFIKI